MRQRNKGGPSLPPRPGWRVLLLTGGTLTLLLADGEVRATTPAYDLVLQSVEVSPPRLVDGGEVRVRVTATTPTDVEPRSCSGELSAIGIFFDLLPFSSCAAQRIGPARYELLLTRQFPAAVVNRAFHLGSLVLLGSKGERYTSEPQRDQKLEVISTAVVPDLRNPRVDLQAESGKRHIRPGDRFRIMLFVDSATPVEIATLSLSLLPRDGRRVDTVQVVVRGEGDWNPTAWVERVERGRQMWTQSLTIYAKVPENVPGPGKLRVGGMAAMNQSLQYVQLGLNELELDIER